MTVVSNTSPILNLAAIGEAGLLEKLYSSLLVPPEVAAEIQRLRDTQPRFQSARMPAFVEVATLQNPHVAIALVGELDQGELRPPTLDAHRGHEPPDRSAEHRLGQ